MNKSFLYFILLFFCIFTHAQTKYRLNQLDSLFIQNNLILLAKKYNVDIQKALLHQARLLDNPNIYIEQNIYNSNNKKYFDMSNEGEYIFQIQQLIKTAGKKNKWIAMAKLNYQISQTEFEYLTGQLFYQMHSIFYQLVFLNKTKNILQQEITEMEPLIKEYEKQYEKGNLSLKEVFRLKGLLFNVQSIVLQLNEQLADLKKDLSVFTSIIINENTTFEMDIVKDNDLTKLNILALTDTALKYRTDYLYLKQNYELNKVNYQYQKALAVPDVQLGYNFDKAGSFMPNYSAFSLAFNLPVFNRNQGNIKAAEFLMKQSEMDIRQKEREIKQEVISAFEKLVQTSELYKNVQKDFLKNFDNIKDGMRENFNKRNISVLEYADFFDSYINAVQQYFTLLNQYYYQIETFNYNVGKKIIK